jgi:hypothetical protein
MTGWRQHFAAYLAAQRQHREASRVMARAERVLDRLIERGVDEDRAYKVAGVGLADVRAGRAYQEMSRALETLRASAWTSSTAARLVAHGVWLCADVPRAANKNYAAGACCSKPRNETITARSTSASFTRR